MKANIWKLLPLVIFFFAGCGFLKNYTHYKPNSGSLFNIEFDYPIEWVLDVEADPLMSTETIIFRDPTNITPTAEPQFRVHPTVDFGFIYIQALISNLDIPIIWNMDQFILELLVARENMGVTLLRDREVLIDGREARWLTFRWKSKDIARNQRHTVISEEIFIPEKGGYYEVVLMIPEKDRNNAFGQGFDYLVASIKFAR